MEIKTADVFAPLYTTTSHFIILRSGRLGGKTIACRDYLMSQFLTLRNRDIVICRDSYSDLKDSLFAAIQNFVSAQHLEREIQERQNPLRFYNFRTNNTIYFLGIGGADKSRTKSFEPSNKVEVVLFEELQQVREQSSLEQAHASFRRHLSPTGKFIHCFNPEPQNANWVNVWYTIKREDVDYLCIESSWRDIAMFVSDLDIREMLKCKMTEPEKYDWLYMGKTGGGFGSVYPQFKREKHLLTLAQMQTKFAGHYITTLIIGGDNAVSRDGTCLCPIAIMDNGQCVVLDVFYHSPKEAGDLSVSELLPYMQKWLKFVLHKYRMDEVNTPVSFIIDGSVIGIELIKELRHVVPSDYDVIAYKDKHVIELAGNLKSVFARNMLYIVDYGGRQDWVRDRWIAGDNIVAAQVENLVWNDKQTGFDPLIPNDASDALTYGANAIFKNPFNLYYVDRSISVRKDFYDME